MRHHPGNGVWPTRSQHDMSGGCAGGDAAAKGSKPPQVHEGFSEALGLPLQTADGELLFKPTRTRYYQTVGADMAVAFRAVQCRGAEEVMPRMLGATRDEVTFMERV